MKEAPLSGQVDGSARRAIRNTLKLCVPRAPLTHDAIRESGGKWEIGKPPQSMAYHSLAESEQPEAELCTVL
ncbi:hypothetical protein GCM10011391_02380 [Pullulanibacillus camelliae]|uniref:Uncharacterized protein n=1 Tax=Pullulanibacillus camelliae TaxID=1707096 RepID=A0A8J2VDG7_9BACL|nr:hypothetical protein GCM10011391_02380 [Pullulanibacillus camelliae]